MSEFPYNYEDYEDRVSNFIVNNSSGETETWLMTLYQDINNIQTVTEFKKLPTTYEMTIGGKKIFIPSKKLNKDKRTDGDLINRDQVENFKTCLEILYFYAFVKFVNLMDDVKIWDDKDLAELSELQSRL